MVNFQAMQAILANVWHPIGGVSITDISESQFLFQFYHKVDVGRIEAWSLKFQFSFIGSFE